MEFYICAQTYSTHRTVLLLNVTAKDSHEMSFISYSGEVHYPRAERATNGEPRRANTPNTVTELHLGSHHWRTIAVSPDTWSHERRV